jgi:hypothetical protein
MRYPVSLLPVVAAVLSWSAPLRAAGELDSDCHALKLVAASGIPGGTVRNYTFSGTCNVITGRASGPFVEKTVPVEASATWDPAMKELSETFRVLAEFDGLGKFHIGNKVYTRPWHIKPLPVTSRFACNDDPLVTNAACSVLAHETLSEFAPFSNPAKRQSRPLLKGKTNLAEATKLAAVNKPLPWKRGALSPATAVAFEAEQLFQQGKAKGNGGTLAVQPMQNFGNGWGNNAQLFWSGGAPGAILDLSLNVPASAKYRVELFMTRAPDYGDLLLQVEGNTASASFSGFASAVVRSNAIDVGTFELPAGEQRISLKIIGKNTKSSGFLVGVDQVRLSPASK